MATEISLDKQKVGTSLKTLAAVMACIFSAGGAYTQLHGEVEALKRETKVLTAKEERRSERDSETALHMQRIDDGLDHMREAIDRIDRNVQAMTKR
jgi:hypothetical protein